MNIDEAKEVLTSNVTIDCRGANFSFALMSPYAFKHEKWGSPCNVVYVETKRFKKFYLLSELKPTLCLDKWSISEAEPLLLIDNSNYIITNLTQEEISAVQDKLIKDYGFESGWY